MNNELIDLIVELYESNERGFPVPTVMRFSNIFARINDVRRVEFYAAASANVRVSLTATINTEDWKHCNVYSSGRYIYPTKVVYEETEYEIVRHYRYDEFATELVLREVE